MAHAEPRQSYGASSGRPNLPGLVRRTPMRWTQQSGLVLTLEWPYTHRRTFGGAGRSGRSVVASASALGAEDRRFESCRPDSVNSGESWTRVSLDHGTRV